MTKCSKRSNVNVNVWHTYWAPLNLVTEALHAVELTLFLWHMPEGVAEHSFLGCNHQSTCMPSYSLYVQLLWYPMYYPGGMKARVSPVQWSELHSILGPTQDSNPGGRIDGFRIISGDHYTTTSHCINMDEHHCCIICCHLWISRVTIFIVELIHSFYQQNAKLCYRTKISLSSLHINGKKIKQLYNILIEFSQTL